MNQDLIKYAFAGEDFSKPYTLAEAATFFHGRNILNLGELDDKPDNERENCQCFSNGDADEHRCLDSAGCLGVAADSLKRL